MCSCLCVCESVPLWVCLSLFISTCVSIKFTASSWTELLTEPDDISDNSWGEKPWLSLIQLPSADLLPRPNQSPCPPFDFSPPDPSLQPQRTKRKQPESSSPINISSLLLITFQLLKCFSHFQTPRLLSARNSIGCGEDLISQGPRSVNNRWGGQKKHHMLWGNASYTYFMLDLGPPMHHVFKIRLFKFYDCAFAYSWILWDKPNLFFLPFFRQCE